MPSEAAAQDALQVLREYLEPAGYYGVFYELEYLLSEFSDENKAREAAEKQRATTHKAALTLKSLQNTADYGEYYARNISERLAKAWANGEHRPKGKVYKADEPVSSADRNAAQNAATGVTIEGAIDSFQGCLDIVMALDKDLADPVDEKAAEVIYDAYDDSLDEYWGFIHSITDGLKRSGVKQYLGPTYKSLFQKHLEAFGPPGEKIVEKCGPKLDTKTPHQKPRSPLDMSPNLTYLNKPQTPEKLRSWTERTKQYLKDGIAAC